MKYFIFTDIDGTIYNKDRVIHPLNIKMVKEAQNLGIEVVICTGNGYFNKITKLADELNIRFCITSNGAAIFDRQTNQFLVKNYLPESKVAQLLDYSYKQKIPADWWDEKNIYINKFVNEEQISVIKNVMLGNKEPIISDKADGGQFKIEFYSNIEDIEKISKFLENKNFESARMTPFHLEVTNNNVSKGDAIMWFCQKFKLDKSNLMGIGDSANDLSMFKVLDFSYAMANAPDDVKKAVKYHTSAVEQGGLGEAIADFIFRKKIKK